MVMTVELTPLQQVILDVLKGAGSKWMTRADISNGMERPKRLNPHDVKMLEALVETGVVEKSQRVRSGATVQTEFIYRLK